VRSATGTAEAGRAVSSPAPSAASRVGSTPTDRVALVTGATGGLGRAIVAALEEDGWRVAGAAHRHGPLAADLSRPEAAGALVEQVVERFGHLDLVVVNHAAMAMAPVDVHPLDEWWTIVETNLGAAFRLARAAAPHLIRRHGALLFVGSTWGLTGWPGATAYAASKAGLVGLTKALALELAPQVRVNLLAPGVVATPQLAVDAAAAGVTVDEIRERYAATTPLGRIADPAEIARSVVFLASPAAAYYTGQVLSPNGGTVLVP
jgi:2-hydroxycyclohexanecarboxyl-CoA dehydrogenase